MVAIIVAHYNYAHWYHFDGDGDDGSECVGSGNSYVSSQ